MERSAMKDLIAWKNKKGRKPLLLRGARQVGKTWLMKTFGEKCFSNTVYLNFDKDPRLKEIFEADYDIGRILRMLNIEAKTKIVPEKTLLIFDEIQEAPRAISALKYFCEDAPEIPVIAAGSLLGVAIHRGVSFPVGKIDTLDIYPMSFSEFLLAMGESGLAELLAERDYEMLSAFDTKYAQWLKLYYFIGGMPEAVHSYEQDGDVVSVRKIQTDILNLYQEDFSKHVEKEELPRIRMVWNAIPLQLAKENKKFFFGKLKAGARAKDFELAIEWLLDCGLIYKVHRVEKPGVPLKGYMDFSAYKIFLVDVGLLGAMSDLDADVILNGNDMFTEFKGALAEQYVLQELEAETSYTPYYFSSSSHTEIDFLIQKEGSVIPIEVKAEKNLKAKSLKAYYEKYQPNQAIRTSMYGYRKDEWLVNLPLYAICTI